MLREHQHEVIQWAKALVEQSPVILDTETTGLNDGGEICQIAIVRFDGAVLLDTLVKPKLFIPLEATHIHGITNAMVEGAPTWVEVSDEVMTLIRHRPVVIYNAAYDRRMLLQSDRKRGISTDWDVLVCEWHCAMERYAEYYGEWNDYRGNYRWQKLTDACRQQGIKDPDAPAHSALGDCLRTLALVKYLASQ